MQVNWFPLQPFEHTRVIFFKMKAFVFDEEMAKEYGVENAVMIWNFQYWIQHNETNGKHFYNGRYWTFNSVDAFMKQFPFWSRGQIRRILKSLEENDVIMTGNYNSSAYDRTMWYAFTDSFLHKHLQKSTNGCDQTENSNSIVSNQEHSDITNVNTDKAADGGLFQSEPEFQPTTVVRPKRTSEPACLFENSRYYNFNEFAKEFKGPEYTDIDMVYYYHAVADWSAQKGKKMKDWIATARNFIRSDMEKGKLHRKTSSGTVLDADTMEYLREMAQ